MNPRLQEKITQLDSQLRNLIDEELKIINTKSFCKNPSIWDEDIIRIERVFLNRLFKLPIEEHKAFLINLLNELKNPNLDNLLIQFNDDAQITLTRIQLLFLYDNFEHFMTPPLYKILHLLSPIVVYDEECWRKPLQEKQMLFRSHVANQLLSLQDNHAVDMQRLDNEENVSFSLNAQRRKEYNSKRFNIYGASAFISMLTPIILLPITWSLSSEESKKNSSPEFEASIYSPFALFLIAGLFLYKHLLAYWSKQEDGICIERSNEFKAEMENTLTRLRGENVAVTLASVRMPSRLRFFNNQELNQQNVVVNALSENRQRLLQ